SEESDPLRAGLPLRGVDRIPAKLDVQAAAIVPLGGRDQLLAVLLGDVPAGNRQGEGGGSDRAVLGYAHRGVLGDVIDLLGLREERVHALAGPGTPGTRRVLPDDIDLLAGVAAEPLLG